MDKIVRWDDTFFTGGAFAALREGFARYKIGEESVFLQILQGCILRGIQAQTEFIHGRNRLNTN